MDKNKIIIFVGDHNAWEYIQQLTVSLRDKFNIINLTPLEKQMLHYPEQAKLLANVMARNENVFGIAICGTGLGLSVELNRYPFIRCAAVNDKKIACLSKIHNNSNALALGAWSNTVEEIEEIITEWINTPWEKGRHQIRVELLNRGKLTNIVVCPGVYDVLKPHHIRLLTDASKIGKVVVLLNSDASTIVNTNQCPMQNEESRSKILSSLNCVDEVIINEYETAEYWIKTLGANYVMKGALDTEENIRKIDGIPDDVKLILFPKC